MSYCCKLWSVPPFWQGQLHELKNLGKKFAVSTSCRPLGVWFTKSSYFSCTSHPECSFLCANIYLNIYIIIFQISIFLKVGVYQYICLLMWQILLKRSDYLYSNIVDYQRQFSSVWSLWGSVTLRVSSWIDQTHYSWWIECSTFLSKKASILPNFWWKIVFLFWSFHGFLFSS